jgi:hypothetical protein
MCSYYRFLGFNTESKETFQCPVSACHAKIALHLSVHQLLLFNIEMLICLENTLFLLITYYISCCIHNIFCDPCCWFSQGSIVGRVSNLLQLGSLVIESQGGGGSRIFHGCPAVAALPAAGTMGIGSVSLGGGGVKHGVDAHHH